MPESREIALTPEQASIVGYRGPRLVVKAYAGTGKTFTLVQYALANTRDRILYLAYNRAIKDEAKNKFPPNVECKTSHQLAYASIGYGYAHKLSGNLRLKDIAQCLMTKNWTLAKDVRDTLNAYMASADHFLLFDHLERANTGQPLTSRQEQYITQVMESADEIWRRMIDHKDDFPIVHDAYLKLYQLNQPQLDRRYSIILFDEAQDANPVTSNIVLQQQCKVILVGDSHQQIYRFRGANNALDDTLLDNADRLYLTHSFRFGSNVAAAANALLSLKGETRPVVGLGKSDSIVTSLPPDIGHRAILHRTVMGVIGTAIMASQSGKKVFWVGGIDSYQLKDLLDLYWFSIGRLDQVKNARLKQEYEDIEEYESVAEATKDPEMNRGLKVIATYDDIPGCIATLRAQAAADELEADITVATAHRAKGLEWDYVQLCDDFPEITDPELEDEARIDETNLLYVACTRAMRLLALNSSLELAIRHAAYYRMRKQKADSS